MSEDYVTVWDRQSAADVWHMRQRLRGARNISANVNAPGRYSIMVNIVWVYAQRGFTVASAIDEDDLRLTLRAVLDACALRGLYDFPMHTSSAVVAAIMREELDRLHRLRALASPDPVTSPGLRLVKT